METIGDGIISEIKLCKKDLYNCNCNTQKELLKSNVDLLEALEKARDDINWMLNSRQFLNADVFNYIDAAIAAARGTV